MSRAGRRERGATRQHITPRAAAAHVMPRGWDFQRRQSTFPASTQEGCLPRPELRDAEEPCYPLPAGLALEIAINCQNIKARSYLPLSDRHLREPGEISASRGRCQFLSPQERHRKRGGDESPHRAPGAVRPAPVIPPSRTHCLPAESPTPASLFAAEQNSNF